MSNLGETILVVEDDANTRKLMETVLKQNGYQPLLARDGVEALEVLDRKHVDLIVLDMAQPYWHPVHDVLNNLVFSASGADVCLTMVDVRVLYRDGVYPTLDLERIYSDAERIRTRILAQLA